MARKISRASTRSAASANGNCSPSPTTNGGEEEAELELARGNEVLEVLLEDEADDRHDRERDRGRDFCDLAADRPDEVARRATAITAAASATDMAPYRR